MFILDTNVVSELRKVRANKADKNVARWANKVRVNDLYLSVITIGELEVGVLRMERRDAAQGVLLRTWLDQHVLPAFSDRIFPVNVAIAQCCAKLLASNPCPDRDALIAATALVHGMKIVTRNVADFQPTGVQIINPW